MMDHLKSKHIFSPIVIVFISVIMAAAISRIEAEPNNNTFIMVIFYSLFIYWFAALVFNIRGFMKNRIPTRPDKM